MQSNANVITNANGQIQSAVGPVAVEALALRTLIVGLRFEARTGMKMSRVSLKAVAKQRTGLRTNDTAKLIAGVEALLDAKLAQCTIQDANEK